MNSSKPSFREYFEDQSLGLFVDLMDDAVIALRERMNQLLDWIIITLEECLAKIEDNDFLERINRVLHGHRDTAGDS